MSLSKDNETHQEVFRDKIKEGRGNYFVEYQPADERYSFSYLGLVFPQDDSDAEAVSRLMEQELERWLKRFPVPVMVTAWDIKEDAIHIPSKRGESVLWGYINAETGKVTRKWGNITSEELPAEQTESGYLERVYEGVPFRLQEEVRLKAEREWQTTVLTANLIVLFIVVIPVLIEIVGLGVAWLGYILSGISITAGLYKLAKHIGWIKPSKRQQEKDKENLKKEHYFYHCELNPAGFNRLKIENFERDAIERTRKEAEMLKKAV
jgi:hypothetical protein